MSDKGAISFAVVLHLGICHRHTFGAPVELVPREAQMKANIGWQLGFNAREKRMRRRISKRWSRDYRRVDRLLKRLMTERPA